MSERREVSVTVRGDITLVSAGRPLREFMDHLQRKLTEVPDEFKATAYVSFSCWGRGDDPPDECEIYVGYRRPETDGIVYVTYPTCSAMIRRTGRIRA